jgi:hypothetical protein
MFRVYAWRGLNPGHDLYERTEELVWFTPFSGRELAFCEAHWPALAEFMREADECAARFRRELSERWSRQYEAVLDGTSPDDTSG